MTGRLSEQHSVGRKLPCSMGPRQNCGKLLNFSVSSAFKSVIRCKVWFFCFAVCRCSWLFYDCSLHSSVPHAQSFCIFSHCFLLGSSATLLSNLPVFLQFFVSLMGRCSLPFSCFHSRLSVSSFLLVFCCRACRRLWFAFSLSCSLAPCCSGKRWLCKFSVPGLQLVCFLVFLDVFWWFLMLFGRLCSNKIAPRMVQCVSHRKPERVSVCRVFSVLMLVHTASSRSLLLCPRWPYPCS